ncbi:MAG: hypothetical protein WC692_07590 [Erythrobacter sp.]|jgi:hypothetical protein
MPDRRRITDVEGLTQIHLNYRDAVRPIVSEPLCFDIIWADLIVDALQLVTPDELAAAMIRAGVDADGAQDIAETLSSVGLSFDGAPD